MSHDSCHTTHVTRLMHTTHGWVFHDSFWGESSHDSWVSVSRLTPEMGESWTTHPLCFKTCHTTHAHVFQDSPISGEAEKVSKRRGFARARSSDRYLWRTGAGNCRRARTLSCVCHNSLSLDPTDRGDRTSNNYDCQNFHKFSLQSPYISNTFSRESPNFHTCFRVCKWSPCHSKDLTRKSLDLEIQIFEVWSPPWVDSWHDRAGSSAITSVGPPELWHTHDRVCKWVMSRI